MTYLHFLGTGGTSMAKHLTSLKNSGIPIVSPSEARGLIQDADIFFCCGVNPAALVIRGVTGSILSHTGLLYRDGQNIPTIESTFTQGVHEGNVNDYINCGDGDFIITRLNGITSVEAQFILNQARALIGKHYEVNEEIQMLLNKLCPLFKVEPEYKEYFCSGEVQEALVGTQFAIPDDKDGGNATPEDVWESPFIIPICAVVSA